MRCVFENEECCLGFLMGFVSHLFQVVRGISFPNLQIQFLCMYRGITRKFIPFTFFYTMKFNQFCSHFAQRRKSMIDSVLVEIRHCFGSAKRSVISKMMIDAMRM